jgi:hypothetical protein
MDRDSLIALLAAVAANDTPIEEAAARLSGLPVTDTGEVRIDTARAARRGFPEVVFCEGKSADQLKDAARVILEHSEVLLGTRADAPAYEAIARVAQDARYHERARVVVVDRRDERPLVGHIVIASAGAADAPVAEEAAVSAEVMGNQVTRIFDVGVAGIHRVLAHSDDLRTARVVIAVAGMEGALPSVVAGLVACPVIGVPTSVGYGVSFGGVSALLTMLNSCAAGVAVVNIDNGFGAARVASMINQAGEAGGAAAPEADAP